MGITAVYIRTHDHAERRRRSGRIERSRFPRFPTAARRLVEAFEGYVVRGAEILERLSDQCTERGGSPTVRIVITQIFCVPNESLLRRGATVELRPALKRGLERVAIACTGMWRELFTRARFPV